MAARVSFAIGQAWAPLALSTPNALFKGARHFLTRDCGVCSASAGPPGGAIGIEHNAAGESISVPLAGWQSI